MIGSVQRSYIVGGLVGLTHLCLWGSRELCTLTLATILCSVPLTSIPAMPSPSRFDWARGSMKMTKRVGDKQQPCLVDLSRLNQLVRLPFIFILAFGTLIACFDNVNWVCVKAEFFQTKIPKFPADTVEGFYCIQAEQHCTFSLFLYFFNDVLLILSCIWHPLIKPH